MRLSVLFIPVALALLGCPPVATCNEGFVWDGTRCVPDAVADAGADVGPSDTPSDVSSDAGPCGGLCSGSTPRCDESSGMCVECLARGDCSGATPACVMNECVACETNADCTMLAASRCGATNECGACTADMDCMHLSATPVCDEARSTCVACTADTEMARCGANSCNPATNTCTATPRTSVRRCGSCVADTECMEANDRCVPMQFMGADRAGGYCLPQADLGCARPYTAPTPMRASLSGAAAEAYCGVYEMTTTCEAVLALVDDGACASDAECGAAGLDDGRCETVNFVANRCTYSCSLSNGCPTGAMCGGPGYCGS